MGYGSNNIGQVIRDALESIEVDVDGIMSFLETKGIELEEMQMRHGEELETFLEEAALEAEAQFADDAQKIQDAVIGAIQDWANSLDEMAPMVKRAQNKKAHMKPHNRNAKKAVLPRKHQSKRQASKARKQEADEVSWSLCRND